MTKTVVLSGHGRYEDKWHDFAGTSHVVANELAAMGLTVEVRSLAKDVLTNLDDVGLLVINMAGGRVDPEFDGDDAEWAPARQGLAGYMAAGKPVLALHSSCYTFSDNPAWPKLVGATWIEGSSFHPPFGRANIEVVPQSHPVVAGWANFTVNDERYSELRMNREVSPYLVHQENGQTYPLAWALEHGASRLIYNALGHAVESYSQPRLALLRREANWLLGN